MINLTSTSVKSPSSGVWEDLTSISKDTEVKKESQSVVNQIATTANISPISAARFKKLKSDAPEYYDKVQSGEYSLTAAYNEVLAAEKLAKSPKKASIQKVSKTAIFAALQNKKLFYRSHQNSSNEI